MTDTVRDAARNGASAGTEPRPMLRRPGQVLVTGVSAGVADHLGWNADRVRAAFVILTFFWGIGFMLYVWLWVFVPRAETGPGVDGVASPRAPMAWMLTGVAVLGVLVTAFAVFGHPDDPASFVPVPAWTGCVLVVTALAVTAGGWSTLVDRRDPSRGPRHETAVRIVLTVSLVILFVLAASTLRQGGIASFVVSLVPLIGIAALYASTLVDRWRELSRERVRRIREEQRSEMAAHLHDSVLQTLALIQNRAGGSTEVARIARAQERELRSWLYDGDSPADSDLPTDLRDYAAALELDYPVHIDVVAAGATAERASGELAAASREAMLNAARHAGGDVSVYIEGTHSHVEVFVRDRGPGFDLDGVPSDRLGVRESIIGRVRRAGGTATVRRGAGGVGTEVHLAWGEGSPGGA